MHGDFMDFRALAKYKLSINELSIFCSDLQWVHSRMSTLKKFEDDNAVNIFSLNFISDKHARSYDHQRGFHR